MFFSYLDHEAVNLINRPTFKQLGAFTSFFPKVSTMLEFFGKNCAL